MGTHGGLAVLALASGLALWLELGLKLGLGLELGRPRISDALRREGGSVGCIHAVCSTSV